jgi:Mrp family chromosome partitioning ATPase
MMATALAIKEAANNRGSKIVGILGISPDQNGALLSCNFAVACAQVGTRTLLVELNEKRQGMLSALSPAAGKGLRQVLRGEIDLNAALEPVPSEPALQLLAAYQANPDVPWTRDEVGVIRGYLETLSDQFDLIFVDLPPKTSVVYPCALAVDGVVLVGSADRSKMSEISDAALFLRGVGKQILGVVISRLA